MSTTKCGRVAMEWQNKLNNAMRLMAEQKNEQVQKWQLFINSMSRFKKLGKLVILWEKTEELFFVHLLLFPFPC